ncbi:solute carrier family 22 member 15-like [Tubulanus polymorphus]|uniref:solute carrier family 22 member 15-like n=1 Tax=Tubulanus polymorphus TaxID=672921 RepID=UPI003DA27514
MANLARTAGYVSLTENYTTCLPIAPSVTNIQISVMAKENVSTEEHSLNDEGNTDETLPMFDDLFKIIGEVGLFQVFMYVMYVLIEANGATIILYFVLDIANPGWFCPGSGVNVSSSTDLVKGYCDVSGLPCQNFSYSQEYTSTITEWDLICDRKFIGSTMTSIFFVGNLIGATVFSSLSDLFGRKKALMASWAVSMTLQLASSWASVWVAYMILRFFTGVAAGGLISVSTVVISEFLGPKWRSLAAYRIGWHFGPAIMITSAYLLREWRYVSIVISVWTMPAFIVAVFFLPESARWLIQKKRYDQAEFWIKRMATMNRRSVPHLSNFVRLRGNEKTPCRYTCLDLFRSRRIAVMSLCVMYAWFSCAFISYGIAGQMSTLTGNIYLNLGISMCATVFIQWIICIYVPNWIGRRKTYPLFMGITGLCMATVLILDILKVAENRIPQTVLAITSSIIMSGAWAASLLFATELYPTVIRNISTGAGNVAARIAGIIAPQAALLEMYHISAPYAVYGFLAITSSVAVYALLPETYGLPLPEHLDDVVKRAKVKVINSSASIPLPESANLCNSSIESEENFVIEV